MVDPCVGRAQRSPTGERHSRVELELSQPTGRLRVRRRVYHQEEIGAVGHSDAVVLEFEQPDRSLKAAAAGGTIALVEPGDRVRIDIPNRSMDILVDIETLDARRST